MNKTHTIWIGLLIVFVGFLIFLPKSTNNVLKGSSLPPILIITSGEITIQSDANDHLAESGEELKPPLTLVSNDSGTATILMPDGSELRLDVSTELILLQADFNEDDGELALKAKISLGRVWSSIIKLVTPESAWEVTTSNVVATVRGTAFSLSVTEENISTLLGAENTITLGIIDPETGERRRLNDLPIGPNDFITVGNELARQIVRDKAPLAKNSIPQNVKNDVWYTTNQQADKETREFIDALKGSEGNESIDPREIFDALLQNKIEDFKTDISDSAPQGGVDVETGVINETTLINQVENVTPTTDVISPVPPTAPTSEDEVTEETDITTQIISNEPTEEPLTAVSLSIRSSADLNTIAEGTPVVLIAELLLSDNSTKDVTSEVTWRVEGPIGTIDGNIFYPQLNSNTADLGEAIGSIVSIWTNPSNNEQIIVNTGVFGVTSYISTSEEEPQ